MATKQNDTLNDKAEQIAEEASKTAAELGRELHHHAENAKSDMVKTLFDAAKALRKQSHEAGASEEVQERLDDVATGFEKAASYLKTNSYSDIGEDAVRTAKNNPMQTAALVFIIGVIIGMLLRGNRSSER